MRCDCIAKKGAGKKCAGNKGNSRLASRALTKWTIVHFLPEMPLFCQRVLVLGCLQMRDERRNTGSNAADLPIRKDNRQTLIDATLASIAEIGLIRTSVSEIITRANLSRGMIHLHFNGKDNLLAAAAKHASERYYKRLDRPLHLARPEPQYRIEALILCDLSEEGLSEDIVRITHEFQAATRALPILAPYSDTRDVRLRGYFEDAFIEVLAQCREPDPTHFSQDITTGLVATLEGFWIDFLLHPQDFDRDRAARIVFRMLMGVLPEYFDLSGAKDPG